MNTALEVLLAFFAEMNLTEEFRDPTITDLMFVEGRVFVDRGGELEQLDRPLVNEESLKAVIEVTANRLRDSISAAKPYLDAELPDGSRLAAIYPPVSRRGVTLTIRKFARRYTLEELQGFGMFAEEACQVLLALVEQSANVLVSGATGVGKTALLNALIGKIPPKRRIITIEKPTEFLIHHGNAPRFEAVPAIGEKPGFSVAQILAWTLRQRPDHIIVGEVRGPEAYDLIDAMNTGHSGTFSTIHTATCEKALERLASLARAGFGNLTLARLETGHTIQFVVQLAKDRAGIRRLTEIVEVHGYEEKQRRFRTTSIFRDPAFFSTTSPLVPAVVSSTLNTKE